MFQIFHNFWVQQIPMFQGTFDIFYVIMDFLTVLVFLKILFEIGNFAITFGGRK